MVVRRKTFQDAGLGSQRSCRGRVWRVLEIARRPLGLERGRERGRVVQGFGACLAALILPRVRWKGLHRFRAWTGLF